METKMIAANNEETVWKKITADLSVENPPLQYQVLIYHDDKKILLDIDIDPGGGFESGYESTTLTATVHNLNGYKFAVHHEDFLDVVGKFFGMQDVEIGYPEFDKDIIVKTNDTERTKHIFLDEEVRKTFQSLTGFTFNTITKHTEEDHLEFTIDKGMLDTAELRKIYTAFVSVLSSIEALEKNDYKYE
jgi:hypothetical protein